MAVDKAGVVPDEGVALLDKSFTSLAAKRFWDREPTLRTLA
jgi:catalase